MPHNDDALLRATLDDYLEVEVPVAAQPTGEDADLSDLPVAPAPDEEFANRLLYKGRKLAEEQAKVKALADAERARVGAWEADMSHGIRNELTRLKQSLEMFVRNWHRDHPRTKTLKLANGTLALKAAGGRVIVTDPSAFIAWATKRRPDLLRTEPAIAKAKLADELLVTRHKGVQQNVDDFDGALADTWILMAEVETVDEASGEVTKETVALPGVMFAKPVTDTFTMTLPKPTTNHEGDTNA